MLKAQEQHIIKQLRMIAPTKIGSICRIGLTRAAAALPSRLRIRDLVPHGFNIINQQASVQRQTAQTSSNNTVHVSAQWEDDMKL